MFISDDLCKVLAETAGISILEISLLKSIFEGRVNLFGTRPQTNGLDAEWCRPLASRSRLRDEESFMTPWMTTM